MDLSEVSKRMLGMGIAALNLGMVPKEGFRASTRRHDRDGWQSFKGPTLEDAVEQALTPSKFDIPATPLAAPTDDPDDDDWKDLI